MFAKDVVIAARLMIACCLTMALTIGLQIGLSEYQDHQSNEKHREMSFKGLTVMVEAQLARFDYDAIEIASSSFMSQNSDIAYLRITDQYKNTFINLEHDNSDSISASHLETLSVLIPGTVAAAVIEITYINQGLDGFLLELGEEILIAFVAAFIPGVSLMIWFIRRNVSDPLIQFEKACENTLKSDEQVQANLVGVPAFKRFARLFNEMQANVAKEKELRELSLKREKVLTTKLQSSMQILNDEVRERKLLADTLDNILKGTKIGVAIFSSKGVIISSRGAMIDRLFDRKKLNLSEIEHDFWSNNGRFYQDTTDYTVSFVDVEVDGHIYAVRKNTLLDGLYSITHIDVTDERKVFNDLAHSQKLQTIGELTSGLAHDMNNLLSVIQGCLELINSSGAQSSQRDIKPFVDMSLKSVQQGASLTQQLLAYSRKQALAPKQVALGDLLKEMESFFSRSLGPLHNLHIDVKFSSMVHIDANQLQTALLNLVLNSKYALPKGGDIWISLDVSPSNICPINSSHCNFVSILVKDNGLGMSESIQKKAFDPFFTTKPSGDGSGLGLSMVQGFIEQSGGFVVLGDPDIGAEVYLFIPVLKEKKKMINHNENSEEEYVTQKRMVYVVDDNDLLLDVMVQTIESLGFDAKPFEGPALLREAIERGECFDTLLTDQIMPGEEGTDLARWVKQQRPDVGVIIMSGQALDELEHQIRDLSRSLLLKKPSTRKEIADALEAVYLMSEASSSS